MSNIKNWNEIRTNDSWAIFKILAEFVEGYERMAKLDHVFPFSVLPELSQTTSITKWGLK